MSLDVFLLAYGKAEIFSANITHNLAKMASEAGIYYALWRPEEIGLDKAGLLIGPLSAGLSKLKGNPDKYESLNPENGWGSYIGLVEVVEKYLAACIEFPEATIRVWR